MDKTRSLHQLFSDNKAHHWRRYLLALPMALCTTVALLLWMVKLTWIDPNSRREEPTQARVVDFIVKPNPIKTAFELPQKPQPPRAQPELPEQPAPELSNPDALNMEPLQAVAQFERPKLEINNSDFSYMGLGLRRVKGPRAQPSYPREAKYAGIEGTVYLEYDINTRGQPENIRVLESIPAGVFDQAAISAVRKWRYMAKFVNGKAVATPNFRNRINFRLDELNLAANE